MIRVCGPLCALLVVVAFSAAAGGCGDTPTAPSAGAPFSRTDLRAGTGAEVVLGSFVTVHYTGWLLDPERPEQKGAQFDSSAGRDPFSLFVGGGQVIAGWDQGLPGMRVGGLRRLIIPPSLGYGSVRNGPIPPHATLLFEIELLDVQ